MRSKRRLFYRRTAALAAVFCTLAAVRSGRMPELIAQAAAFSAAFSAPDAAAAALRERFSDLTREEEPNPLVRPEESKPENSPAKEPSSSPSSTPEEEAPPPEIPEEYRGTLLTEDFSGYEGGPYYRWNNAWLRNYTEYTSKELDEILSEPTPIRGDASGEIQVLIYHTHATESYCPYDAEIYDTRYNWRTTDVTGNMVAVGTVLTETLRSYGIGVLHDTSLHDYPSYDGSYANSYAAVSRYLEEYPGIRVVLDVHRDAMEREGNVIVKPAVEIDGEKYAQLMVISNCDDGSGLISEWRQNLRFAAALTDAIETRAPGLTRPILFSHRKYNQQLSTGALLLEFGSHANTLEESKRTARVVGEALAQFLLREELPDDS